MIKSTSAILCKYAFGIPLVGHMHTDSFRRLFRYLIQKEHEKRSSDVHTCIPNVYQYSFIFAVAFRVYDIDGNGVITPSELMEVLRLMVGSNLSDAQLQQIVTKTIQDADLDKDGALNLEEFSKVWCYLCSGRHGSMCCVCCPAGDRLHGTGREDDHPFLRRAACLRDAMASFTNNQTSRTSSVLHISIGQTDRRTERRIASAPELDGYP